MNGSMAGAGGSWNTSIPVSGHYGLGNYLVAGRRGRLAGGSQGTVAPMRAANSHGLGAEESSAAADAAAALSRLRWLRGGSFLAGAWIGYRDAKKRTKDDFLRVIAAMFWGSAFSRLVALIQGETL